MSNTPRGSIDAAAADGCGGTGNLMSPSPVATRTRKMTPVNHGYQTGHTMLGFPNHGES